MKNITARAMHLGREHDCGSPVGPQLCDHKHCLYHPAASTASVGRALAAAARRYSARCCESRRPFWTSTSARPSRVVDARSKGQEGLPYLIRSSLSRFLSLTSCSSTGGLRQTCLLPVFVTTALFTSIAAMRNSDPPYACVTCSAEPRMHGRGTTTTTTTTTTTLLLASIVTSLRALNVTHTRCCQRRLVCVFARVCVFSRGV